MVFSSFQFFVFFAAFLALYASATTYRQRAGILLAASIIFYASWKPAYLILLFGSLTINYLIYAALHRNRKFSLLILGVSLNLLLLGTVKYLALLINTWLALVSWLHPGATADTPEWVGWALPLGISFYTFHMLSVMIDVYRGEWKQPIRFRIWCLYVTFFPHMIAGPILRASELVDQLEKLEPLKIGDIRLGALIFLGGLIKKILFADNLAGLTDELFARPEHLGFMTAWIAAIAFGLQIYFDFSGYSEMAIGLARMLGIVLPRNFLYPYISRNPQEFWHRWHITLSRWLRDYLYFSLGGSRCSMPRVYLNLMLTMLLGGLWHGANWTFVFWGFLHGIYLVGHRLLAAAFLRMKVSAKPMLANALAWTGWLLTMILISFAWIFFRAPNFHDAWTISSAMFGLVTTPTAEPVIRSYVLVGLAFSIFVTLIEPLIVSRMEKMHIYWWTVAWPIRGLCYFGCAMLLIVFGGSSQKFIYFDF